MSASEMFACDELLSFDDASLAECYWVDGIELVATVSDSLEFLPLDNVTLLAGLVKVKCEDGARCDCDHYANESSTVALPPDEPPVPVAVLEGATTVAICEVFFSRPARAVVFNFARARARSRKSRYIYICIYLGRGVFIRPSRKKTKKRKRRAPLRLSLFVCLSLCLSLSLSLSLSFSLEKTNENCSRGLIRDVQRGLVERRFRKDSALNMMRLFSCPKTYYSGC